MFMHCKISSKSNKTNITVLSLRSKYLVAFFLPGLAKPKAIILIYEKKNASKSARYRLPLRLKKTR